MEDLVAQLNTSVQRQPQGLDTDLLASGSTPSSKSSETVFFLRDSSTSDSQVQDEPEALDACSISWGTPSADYGDISFDYGLRNLCEAEEVLTIFRRDFCPEFPFVLLSPEDTSESLRHDKPFLFLSIVAVTSYENPQLQRRLAQEIQKQIASRMVVNNERSLDLLQGLLVHLAWYHYSFQLGSPQILLLLQLCVTLVNEMSLTRDQSTRVTTEYDQVAETPVGIGSAPRNLSLPELRAFLGTFYLCSR